MTISTHSLDQVWSTITKHQKQLNKIIVVLLSLYLLAYLAELTWRLIPSPDPQSNVERPLTSVRNNTPQPKVDIKAIQQLHLFGEAGKKAPVQQPVVQDAPETTLSLTLSGLVASTATDNGAAIIEYRGNQNTYGVGDTIDGTRAVVSEVMRDRVILNNSGKMETLMLDGVDFTKPTTLEIRDFSDVGVKPGSAVKTQYQEDEESNVNQEDVQLNDEQMQAAAELRAQPEKFTDFISIQPDNKGGKINGYRVNPGRMPELFNAAGLEPNDILKEINGLDLTDIKQSMQAMQMLKSEQYLDLTVDRNGEIITLTLELPEP